MATRHFILATIAIMLGCAEAAASDLVLSKIRIADRDGERTRIALEFEGTAKPKGRVSVADDKVIVELEGVRPAQHVDTAAAKTALVIASDLRANASGEPVLVVTTRMPARLAAAPTVLPMDKKIGPRLYFDIERDPNITAAPKPAATQPSPATAAPVPRPAASAVTPELEAAAKGGDLQAQMTLAATLAKLEKPDYAGALQWYRAAAETGNGPAAYNVAQYTRLGLGVPASQPMAFQWYERSAATGFQPAQVALAILLIEGNGVAPDPERARFLLQKAAAAGDPQAKSILNKLGQP